MIHISAPIRRHGWVAFSVPAPFGLVCATIVMHMWHVYLKCVTQIVRNASCTQTADNWVRAAITGAVTSVCGTSRELFRLHSIIAQVRRVTFEANYNLCIAQPRSLQSASNTRGAHCRQPGARRNFLRHEFIGG